MDAATQAALRLGAAYVPLDPMSPPARIRTILESCGPRVLVTTSRRASSVAGTEAVPLLVDQGSEDQFLARELHPHLLEQACRESGQPYRLRMQAGYDHSYWFIQTFMPDHLEHHAAVLCR